MEKSDTRPISASCSGPAVPSEGKGKALKTVEVRRFSLGSIGAVSSPVSQSCQDSLLGCDTDNIKMPPASQTRNRTYKTITQGPPPHQPGRDLSSPININLHHFQPARRTCTFTSHPPLRPTALPITTQRKVRNSTSTMDYMPESFLTPDFLKASLNPSPSSLYMFDQDHQDMRGTPPFHHHHHHHTTKNFLEHTCVSQDGISIPPTDAEFDLNPVFENSDRLEGFLGGASLTPVTVSGTDVQSDCFKRAMMGTSQGSLPESKLTELNIDPYLFDNHGKVGELPQKMTGDVKKETLSQILPEHGPKTFTPLMTVKTSCQSPAGVMQMLRQQQSRSSPCHSSPSSSTSLSELVLVNKNRAQHHAPTLSPTAPTIKTEPMEINSPADSQLSSPCLHKILTSPSSQPIATSPQHPQIRLPSSNRASSTSSLPAGVSLVGGQGHEGRAPTLGQKGKSRSVEEKWKEIEKFIHYPSGEQPLPSASKVQGSAAGAGLDRKRKRHDSDGSPLMSDEDSEKSQRLESQSLTDDEEEDEDFDYDDDSDVSDAPFEESLTDLAKKSKQFFWQYNIQAKGPKGTRLPLNINAGDPHRPGAFEDPVFDPTNTSLVGIRHAGKARKGDGNVVTPNPRKLYNIGQKLCKLTREINSVQLATSLPASVRSKSRKEKNRLSSQACRLKKKAQHEANKIKLFGLSCEQGELLEVVQLIWPTLKERAKRQMKENIPLLSNTLGSQINSIIKVHNKTKVAGNTADYVNQTVAQVEEGDPTGGLPIKHEAKSRPHFQKSYSWTKAEKTG